MRKVQKSSKVQSDSQQSCNVGDVGESTLIFMAQTRVEPVYPKMRWSHFSPGNTTPVIFDESHRRSAVQRFSTEL